MASSMLVLGTRLVPEGRRGGCSGLRGHTFHGQFRSCGHLSRKGEALLRLMEDITISIEIDLFSQWKILPNWQITCRLKNLRVIP
jgi:hypothetical protein